MTKISIALAGLFVLALGGIRAGEAAPASGPAMLAAETGKPEVTATGGSMALTADDRILGNKDAPITIIEYASLDCPHCAAFEQGTLPEIKKNWIDTGKARLVMRDFPLDGVALHAALLARCAPPDKFYGFIDVLFRTQDGWARSSDPAASLERIAKLGGMSGDQFTACMKNDALQNQILAGRIEAQKQFNVQSTPTFIINGSEFVGDWPYADVDAVLKSVAPRA